MKITFPLANSDPSSVLVSYLGEFDKQSIENFFDATLIFSHALRDYLNSSIDEWGYGSLAFALISDKKIEKIIKEDRELYSTVVDSVDIKWLSQGKRFPEYKQKLKLVLKKMESHLASHIV